jgi:hypothetical protein
VLAKATVGRAKANTANKTTFFIKRSSEVFLLLFWGKPLVVRTLLASTLGWFSTMFVRGLKLLHSISVTKVRDL